MKTSLKKKSRKGFTLIELVVVVAILAVLALILIPSISGYVNKANASKNKANARSIYTAAMLVEQNVSFDAAPVGPAGDKVLKVAKNYKPGAEPNKFKEGVYKIVGQIDTPYSISKVSEGYIVEVGGTVTDGGVQYPE